MSPRTSRRDSRRRFGLPAGGAVLALVLSLLSPSNAGAVYQCGPDKDDCKCGANNPYPCCSNGGNCTWWAWDRACCHWGVGLPGWGNANQWSGNAKAHPSYKVVTQPIVGSVATRVSGSYGHVAWVTAVSGSSVTVTEQNCWGGWGHSTATRDKSYWDGGFIVRDSQCDCQPGQTQTQSCGKCGEQKRTCTSSCKWGSWSTCGGQGSCVPGDTESQSCGDCGSKKRTCGSSCEWGSFGSCGGEGECTPGTSKEQACGECGIQTSSCTNGCGWGAPSACESDPSFVPSACSTGQSGVCGQGTQKCIAGSIECEPVTSASAEICDQLDNDCDGQVDEGACGAKPDAGSPKPSPDAGSAGAPAAVEDEPDNAPLEGSACSLGQARSPKRDGLPFAALLLVLARGLRRRTR